MFTYISGYGNDYTFQSDQIQSQTCLFNGGQPCGGKNSPACKPAKISDGKPCGVTMKKGVVDLDICPGNAGNITNHI